MQALLPLKEFAAAKQRLAGLLSAAERAHLFQAMVEDVLFVLTAHSAIERVVICSRDRSAVWLAGYYEVDFFDEATFGVNDLNGAVNAAARRLAREGCDDLLVVHGDLPLLRGNDVSVFLAHHRAAAGAAVTIAPDRRQQGTNLLAWRPLPVFTASYGVDSLQRHCAQAQALNIEPTLCNLAGARCDIDEPEDLLMLLSQSGGAAKTLKFLRNSGIAERLLTLQYSANAAYIGDDDDCA